MSNDEGACLAIETATAVGSVAVEHGRFRLETTLRIQGTHSERIVPAIDYALSTAGVSRDEVGALVIGAGPGSFTGVRVAAALAKGWVAARGTTLYAYCSLLGLAASSWRARPICALFDARRGEVYAACYTLVDGIVTLIEPGVWPVARLCELIRERSIEPAFVGEGAEVYRSDIRERFPRAPILPGHLSFPRASGLLWLRRTDPEGGRVPDPAHWEPLYVREWRVESSSTGSVRDG